jgi:cephalosporin-C deacetylase-like acetyl esterase
MTGIRFAALVGVVLASAPAHADEKKLADILRDLDANVFKPGSDEAKAASTMLSRDVRARLQAANRRSTEEWRQIKTKDDWEKFRDAKLKALRESLGLWPEPPKDLKVQLTGTIEGDGYRIEKLVFESRPGLLVTANLYTPPKPGKSMPGILIIHSHHNPKTQGELQDMGITWAKQGCLVLVPDQIGHGERRQHPFKDAGSFPKPFQISRQDYYFRYNEGIQLHLAGESLIGWIVWDTMRGVDLLLSRPGIDPKRIILLGSVAAGGDPAAVAAALDTRIAAVAPFNFGGPQPETVFPLPADAELSVNWSGGGSWESTRNLRLSARDGFLPWVIVGAVAPRGLIYAHEFAWDKDRDPVWKRLETIYGFYNAGDKLASVHGRGAVTGKPPEATHCNNIGPEHRKGIYPALKQWFDMPIPEKESSTRYKAEELACLTSEMAKAMKPLHVLAEPNLREWIKRGKFIHRWMGTWQGVRHELRDVWGQLLGNVEPKAGPTVLTSAVVPIAGGTVKKIELEVEPGIVLPALILSPEKMAARAPVVVGLCQQGKAAFLKNNAAEVASLLEAGIVVCLPDVRGTGETRAGTDRGRRSSATSIASSELMLGQTLIGSQLRDLRSVLRLLRAHNGVDPERVAVWGTSFAKTNPHGQDLAMPLELESLPEHSEPLGGLLALFGALYEDSVRVVYSQNGLVTYQSVLESRFIYMPYDAVVPGPLTVGDLCDVAPALAPRPLRIETPVDALNRRVSAETLKNAHEKTIWNYSLDDGRLAHNLVLLAEPKADSAKWLIDALKTK